MPDGQVIHVKIIKGREKDRERRDFNRCNKTSRILSLLVLFFLSLSPPPQPAVATGKKNGFTLWLSDRAVDSTRLSIYVYILVLRETSIIRVVTPYLYT